MDSPRGRWAPTPSGLLHIGNARSALLAWLSIRSRGGSFLWRLEDLDPPRILAGAAEQALEDLRWLGLDWDEGPDIGGVSGPYEQSQRSRHYEEALSKLAPRGRLFPCRLSRKDLREIATAPHGTASLGSVAHGIGAASAYPAHLRPQNLPEDWYRAFGKQGTADAALRFRVDEKPVRFHDRLRGVQVERVDLSVGDFVLKRRDGLYAYQLAVVVDDLAMGVTEVVRGIDLLDSTARQIQLIEALAGQPPNWVHVPLIVEKDGEKLSKRNRSLSLKALRESGVRAETLTGYLAYSAGILEGAKPLRPADLLASFDWDQVQLEDWRLPDDIVERLLRSS